MPAPRTPGRLFATLAVLVVAAAILQSGLLTTGPANGGTPGSSGSPGSSAAPPPASGEPSGAPSADVTVEAKGIAFLQASWSGPAETAFTIAFDNQDPGTPHNIELRDSSGASIWKGEIFEGPQIMVYDVPPLAAGAYTFICSVHPNMTGTATLQ